VAGTLPAQYRQWPEREITILAKPSSLPTHVPSSVGDGRTAGCFADAAFTVAAAGTRATNAKAAASTSSGRITHQCFFSIHLSLPTAPNVVV